MTNEKTENGDIQHLAKLVKGVQFAMFTTHNSGENNKMRSRPMTLQEAEFDGDFWFFVGKTATVCEDIESNRNVNLAFAQPKGQDYISVNGVAELSTDPAKMKELWTPAMKAWFPQGLEDPQLCMIRVHVESADYWEAPSSKLVQLYGFTKAILTGKPAGQNEIGTRGHVEVAPHKH